MWVCNYAQTTSLVLNVNCVLTIAIYILECIHRYVLQNYKVRG